MQITNHRRLSMENLQYFDSVSNPRPQPDPPKQNKLKIPLQIGFLVSHGGTNMQAILDVIEQGALKAVAKVVICNNSKAQALVRAKKADVPSLHLSAHTHPEAEALDQAMADALSAHEVGLVVCAGYMRKVGPRVLARFPNRVVNIHPAQLPRHGGNGMYGLRVHQAVLATGDLETCVTVHLVDGLYDHGRPLGEAPVTVLPGDTPEALQARVLETEHRFYPEILKGLANGEFDLDNL